MCQHLCDIQIACVGNLPALQLFDPVLKEQASKVLIKGSGVGEESCTHYHIPHKPGNQEQPVRQ